MSSMKKMVISAMCVTLCVVLPLAAHSIPNAGSLLSPMHIPVLLCGLICGWRFGLLCGLAGPALSCFVTGMPPPPLLPGMMAELAVYGTVTGLLVTRVRTRNKYADLYICLLTAMLAGRIVAGMARAWLFSPGGYTFALWFSGYFVTTLPGILLQLLFIPIIMVSLKKAKLI